MGKLKWTKKCPISIFPTEYFMCQLASQEGLCSMEYVNK